MKEISVWFRVSFDDETEAKKFNHMVKLLEDKEYIKDSLISDDGEIQSLQVLVRSNEGWAQKV